MVSLRALECLVAIVDHGSLTTAAAKLPRATSAVPGTDPVVTGSR
jgi:DNA-binding transcriptional LysR family regulator